MITPRTVVRFLEFTKHGGIGKDNVTYLFLLQLVRVIHLTGCIVFRNRLRSSSHPPMNLHYIGYEHLHTMQLPRCRRSQSLNLNAIE